MPTTWLQRFARIDAFDIDPLAAMWFRARHASHLRAHGVALHYHRYDAIAHLPALLAQHPKACVWFDNLLGQLRYRFGDTDAAQERLHQLHHDLRTHPWGSVHDAYSGKVQQTPPPITPALTLAFERTDPDKPSVVMPIIGDWTHYERTQNARLAALAKGQLPQGSSSSNAGNASAGKGAAAAPAAPRRKRSNKEEREFASIENSIQLQEARRENPGGQGAQPR